MKLQLAAPINERLDKREIRAVSNFLNAFDSMCITTNEDGYVYFFKYREELDESDQEEEEVEEEGCEEEEEEEDEYDELFEDIKKGLANEQD